MQRTALVFAVILIIAGCGTGNDSGDNTAPPGVDPAVWKQLTTRLASELKSASAVAGPHLPPDEWITVDDLTVIPLTDGYQLEWSYKNPGDYNHDGEVNLNDLVRIGLYFGANTSSANWQRASVADGDGNGEISLSDITALAANWRGAVGGYLIAPQFGDGNRNGYFNMTDLAPHGSLLFGQTGILEVGGLEPSNWDIPMFGQMDNYEQPVSPGTASQPGFWIAAGLHPTALGVKDELGRRKFSHRLGGAWDFNGYSVGVIPAMDFGFRVQRHPEGEARYFPWTWESIGETSNLVTLPGWVQ